MGRISSYFQKFGKWRRRKEKPGARAQGLHVDGVAGGGGHLHPDAIQHVADLRVTKEALHRFCVEIFRELNAATELRSPE